jgi:dolichyl-diphosphooligosaccharide--protein glycosyltransferase
METALVPAASKAPTKGMKNTVMSVSRFAVVCWAAITAYTIRLHAVTVYGRVIHEFDPWFNFRATQYLVTHGWRKFFTWYDHESWYPLGRPVGTTIFPGMQFTAAGIYNLLNLLGFQVSLNDVCVFIPAGFSILATLFTALIAREAAQPKHKHTAFTVTAAIMAVIPAHIMRSVAGGFDNESVAVTAIVCVFFFWIRSLRTENSWPFSVAAAIAYGYMVAAWGGYTFVLNMVGVHAAVLFLSGNFTWNLYAAYSVFYVVGYVLRASQIQAHCFTEAGDCSDRLL